MIKRSAASRLVLCLWPDYKKRKHTLGTSRWSDPRLRLGNFFQSTFLTSFSSPTRTFLAFISPRQFITVSHSHQFSLSLSLSSHFFYLVLHFAVGPLLWLQFCSCEPQYHPVSLHKPVRLCYSSFSSWPISRSSDHVNWVTAFWKYFTDFDDEPHFPFIIRNVWKQRGLLDFGRRSNKVEEIMRFNRLCFFLLSNCGGHLDEKIYDVSKNASSFSVVSAIHGHEQGQGGATERRAAAAGCCCINPEFTKLLFVMWPCLRGQKQMEVGLKGCPLTFSYSCVSILSVNEHLVSSSPVSW